MTPIDLDDLAAVFTQHRDRAEYFRDHFDSSTHAGVAAVAAAIAHQLLDGLRAQNLSPEQFRMRAVEALLQIGSLGVKVRHHKESDDSPFDIELFRPRLLSQQRPGESETDRYGRAWFYCLNESRKERSLPEPGFCGSSWMLETADGYIEDMCLDPEDAGDIIWLPYQSLSVKWETDYQAGQGDCGP